jgi:GntR family transcriptional repressor for pyruvate dehydrogenase complex
MSIPREVTPTESAYEQFHQFVAAHRLQPGDRVPSIRELARRFGATTVAVRDALVQAEREGFVEIKARSGAYLRSLSRRQPTAAADPFAVRVVDGQQLHLCHARALLEVETAGLAARHGRPADLLPIREALETWHRGRESGDGALAVEADCEFHVGIARMAGNPVVVEILDQCLRRQHMLECTLPETPDVTRAVIVVHNEIYASIHDRDADRARNAMRRHMTLLEENIHRILSSPPGKNAAKLKAGRRRGG